MAQRAEGRQIKPLYVVAAVIVVLALAYLLFSTIGSGNGTPTPATGTGTTQALPAPSTPIPTTAPTQVFEIFEGRDPFRALVVPDTSGGGGGGGSPAPGTPAPSGSGGGRGGSSGATPAPTAKPQREGVQVELLSVSDDGRSATVRVGSQVHQNAKAGDTLSSGVVVDSIEGKCARFHRGSDSFRLCVGESVLK